MASLQIHEHPFLEPFAYRSCVELTLDERVGEINARTCYFDAGKTIDWRGTDAWRAAGIRELPHPPAGKKYIYPAHTHRVQVVMREVGEEYRHERRRVTGAQDIEYTPGAHIKLHLAEKAAAKWEMQEAIRETRVQLANERKKITK